MNQSSPPSQPIANTIQTIPPSTVGQEPQELAVNDFFGWALASVPAITFVADLFLAQQVSSSDLTLWSLVISLVLNFSFTALDVNELKRAKRYRPGTAFLVVVFVPAYFFMRARQQKTHQGMLVLWLVLFFFTLLARF